MRTRSVSLNFIGRFPSPEYLVGAKDKEVSEHQHRVPQKSKFALGNLCPGDRYFLDGDPDLFGEQEQLDVEDPALDVLEGEDGRCSVAREELEPAWCVPYVPNADDAECEVQGVHSHVAEERALKSDRTQK